MIQLLCSMRDGRQDVLRTSHVVFVDYRKRVDRMHRIQEGRIESVPSMQLTAALLCLGSSLVAEEELVC